MRQFYLTFLSIGVLFVGFSLSKIDAEEYSVDSYKKKNVTVPKPIPPKKRRPLVLKHIAPENSIMNMLVPSMTVVKSVNVEGGGNAVLGGQLNYSVLVTNNGTDATGVTFTDVLSGDLTLVAGSVKASPIAVDESYDCIGNVGINVPAVSGVLANDINPVNTNMTTTAVNTAGTQGTVSLNPDGSFTFVPNVGFSGATTFGYTMSNTYFASIATVTINVSAPIWFVNIAAGSNGTGTLSSPFKDWSDFATSNALSGATNPAANQTIFVYSGTYVGAATLKTGQKVLGQGGAVTLASFVGITVPSFSNPVLPTTSGTNPNLTSSGNTITLNSGNTLRGFSMGASTKDIIGSSFGTLTVSEVTLDGNGQALDLNTGTLAATFKSIGSTNSADEGIELNTVAGTLTSTEGTTITNPSTQGIEIYGNATLTANFGSTNISGSGNVGFTNTSSSATSSTMTFADFDVAPDPNQQAIQTTFKGNFTCTSGTIVTSNAIGGAIGNASSANMESLSMVLDSYSASGSSNGLLIQNTTGSFTINGVGTTAGTGGTISNITAKGVNLNNAKNISLKNMNFTNANTTDGTLTGSSNTAANAAINAMTVAGLTLNNVVVSGTTTQVGLNLNACSNFTVTNSSFTNCGTSGIIEEAGIVAMNLSGTCSISGTTVSTSGGRNVFIRNTGSTLLTALNVTSSTFSTANGASNFLFESIDNANSTMVFKTNTFSNPTTRGLDILAGGATTINVQVGGPSLSDGNTITAKTVTPGSNGLYIQSASNTGSPAVNYNVINNTVQTSFNGYFPINIGGRGTGGQFTGRINNNNTSIVNAVVPTSGMGIYVGAYGRVKHVTEIKNNTINNASNYGIQAETNDNNTSGADGTMDATIQNNNVNMIAGGSAYVHYGLTSNNFGAASGNMVTCANTSGNVSNGVPVAANFEISSNVLAIPATRATVKIQGNYGALPGAWTTPNPSGGATAIDAGGGGTVTLSGAFTCLTPTNTAAARLMAQADNVKPDQSSLQIAEIKQNTLNENSSELSVNKVKENEISTDEVGATDNVDEYSDLESQNSLASTQSGETVTVNGTGSGFNIPAGKNMTITFSATISNTPSTCAITNQASVSGGNFATVNSNITTTNVVIPVPTAVTPASAICNGQSVSLEATCASGTVQWYTTAAPSTLLGTGSPLSQSPTTSTTYTAKCKVGGCESAGTNSGLITVNELPVASPSSNSPVCSGNSLDLTSTSQTSYSWTGPNSFSSSIQNPSITNVTTSASGIYSLTVTNSNGCTASSTVSVTINELPVANPSSDSPKCTGTTLAFNSEPGMSTYAWTGPNSFSSNIQNPEITSVTTAAEGTYSLTVTNSNGCTASSNVAVTINESPVANPSSDSPKCAGSTLSFNSEAGMSTYSWVGPNSFTSDIQNPTITNVTTPAAGIYSITVTNSTGCTASSTISVTINDLPVPNPSSDSPKCTGTTLAFNSEPGMSSYTWTGPNSFSSSIQNPEILNVAPDAAGIYSLTVTHSNGCTASSTVSVTINALPVPNPSSDSPKCSGSTLAFNSESGMSTYAWSGPNSFSSNIQNPTIANVTTVAEGTYSLTVTNSNGCSASSTVSVTLRESPIANPSSDSPKCAGTTLAFNSESGMSSYAWTGPNSFSSSIQNPNITDVTTDAAGIYSLTVTDANGCTSSETVVVTINPLPVPNASSDSPKCVGTTLSFNSETGMSIYAWTGPNSFSSSIQNPSITDVTTDAAGIYSLTVTDANGCTSSETISVTINTLPTPNASSDSPKCVGTTLSFNSETGMSSYAWTGPNSFSSSIQNPNITDVTTGAAGIYNLTVTDANGCTSSENIAVTINSLPTANPSSDSPKCAGTTLAFNSESGMSSYAWTGPNSFSSSIQNPQITNVSTAANGTYTLTVTNSNICTASSTIMITVNELPVPNPSSDSPKCTGSTLAFNSVSGMSTYSWLGPNSFNSNIQNPEIINITTAAAGTYSLTVTNSNGCSASATIQVSINTNISFTAINSDLNNVYACENGAAFIVLNNSFTGEPLNIQWQLDNGGGFSNITASSTYSKVNDDSLEVSNITSTMNNYRYRAIVSNACNSIVADTSTLKVNILPTIINQPIGQTVCVGNQTTLSVLANGSGLSYQWQVNSGSGFSNIVNNLNYSGVNSSSLLITNIQNGFNNYQYRCVIFNQCLRINSNPATLIVDPTITILTQATNKTICQNANTTFNILAVNTLGGSISYQWQRFVGGTTWANLPNNSIYSGVTSSSLSITGAPANLTGLKYRCVINGYCQSEAVTLSVTPIATVINHPAPVTICVGNNAYFSVTAAGVNLTYRWQVNTGSGFVNIFDGGIYQGATTNTLLLDQPNATINSYLYRCVVTGNSSCDVTPAISNSAAINIGISAEAQTIVAVSPISSGSTIYQAVQVVLGLNSITSPARVEYRAGNSILLNPGFEANMGAVFTAKIQNPCSNPTNFQINNSNNLPKEIKK